MTAMMHSLAGEVTQFKFQIDSEGGSAASFVGTAAQYQATRTVQRRTVHSSCTACVSSPLAPVNCRWGGKRCTFSPPRGLLDSIN
eukprot:2128031-Rhodomonas_salina.4